MSKKNLLRTNQAPYHVVNRVNNRDWFHLPAEVSWRLIAHECYAISILFGVRIHAFAMMSNHFHMLLSTPNSDLDAVMAYFGSLLTRSFNRESGRCGHLFNSRYKWSLINSPLYYAHALKYVYRNPVKAGIVQAVEDYRYSSLHGLLGASPLPFPMAPPDFSLAELYVPTELEDYLEWLNKPFKTEHDEAIRRALRRKVFKLPKPTGSKPPSLLETSIG